jgi:superfamily II DNA or RNA helicase
LANSGLVSEGVDLPRADTLLQCCNNSSDVMTYQMLGRILRLSPGKKHGILFDISVSGYEQFERATEKRNQIYEHIVGKENVKIIKL